jgi:hypothetical protein
MRWVSIVVAGALVGVQFRAHAETIEFRCTMDGEPKSNVEEYRADTDENTVTVILHGRGGNVLSSQTFPARITPNGIEWNVTRPDGLAWTLRYDRATGTLTSSNSDNESFTQPCKGAS